MAYPQPQVKKQTTPNCTDSALGEHDDVQDCMDDCTRVMKLQTVDDGVHESANNDVAKVLTNSQPLRIHSRNHRTRYRSSTKRYTTHTTAHTHKRLAHYAMAHKLTMPAAIEALLDLADAQAAKTKK